VNGSFVLTPSASRDIDGILEYVLEHSGANRALRVQQRLYQGLSKVADQPGLGHLRHDLSDESLRVFKVFSYLIIYRPDTSPVQILRVIHGARDVPRAFQEDE
jgi:antitoxin ParD1/3/4/toxin ParE1/3/4